MALSSWRVALFDGCMLGATAAPVSVFVVAVAVVRQAIIATSRDRRRACLGGGPCTCCRPLPLWSLPLLPVPLRPAAVARSSMPAGGGGAPMAVVVAEGRGHCGCCHCCCWVRIGCGCTPHPTWSTSPRLLVRVSAATMVSSAFGGLLPQHGIFGKSSRGYKYEYRYEASGFGYILLTGTPPKITIVRMPAVVTPSVQVTNMACVGHVVHTIAFPQLCVLTPTFAWLYIHMSVTRWDVTPRNGYASRYALRRFNMEPTCSQQSNSDRQRPRAKR
jgi:hypothetical protein